MPFNFLRKKSPGYWPSEKSKSRVSIQFLDNSIRNDIVPATTRRALAWSKKKNCCTPSGPNDFQGKRVNKIVVFDTSRKHFLLGISTAVLAGCGTKAAQILPTSPARAEDVTCPQAVKPLNACNGSPGGGLPGDLSGLTVQQIQAITTTQITALTSSQLGTLTHTQIPVLTSAQCGAFHGTQYSAVLALATRGQAGGPPPSVSNPAPPAYIPPVAGSAFWTWWGTAVGGIVCKAGAAMATANPLVIYVAGAACGYLFGQYMSGAASGSYNFWNPNANGGTGGWSSVEFNWTPGTEDLDSEGYSISGEFDSSTDTVTVTVVAN